MRRKDQMHRLFVFAYILFTIGPAGATESRVCAPFLGTRVTEGPFSAEEFEQSAIFRLDNGNVGTVYRVSPLDTTARSGRIVKELFDAKDLERELDAFSVMTDLLADLPIRIASHRAIGPRQIELQDIYGETLKKVIRSRPSGDPVRIGLESRLRALQAEVKSRLIARFGGRANFEVGGSTFLYARFTNAHGRQVRVAIKAENILIESSTGLWFLIDPY